MSKLVDERVVEMSFDNKKFEENVGTTLGTIDKLKKALNFDEAGDGFAGIEKAASNVDFSGFEDAVGSIGDHLSGFEAIAIGVFTRVGSAVADMAMGIASNVMEVYNSVSYLGTMNAGYTKYEDKTSSVQSLVNATGKSIDEIDGYLEKLMWYSDETSYSFTEMTSALSQAALVGADLGEASDMIIGIANATAFAGKTGAAFQSTIRNLMQSFGSGALKSLDWRSLVLQGTATNRLTEELIRAGEELGRIQHGQVTVGNFTDSLQGIDEIKNWADQSVMELAFSRYAEATQEVYELVNSGLYETATDAIPALLELGWTEQDLGYIAFTAAQQATTFKEAIDATADAVTTGWMRSFEYIFGNYEEAKELWTDLSSVLWDIFAGKFEKQNEVLKLFHDGIDGAKSARDYLLDGIYRVFEIVGTVIDNIKGAWREIFPEKEAEEIAHSIYTVAWRFDYLTKQVLKFVNEEGRVEKFQSVIKGIASVFSILKTTGSAVFQILSSIINAILKGIGIGGGFTKAFDGILGVLAAVGDAITWVAEKYAEIVDDFVNGEAFQGALSWITDAVSGLKDTIAGFISSVWPTVQKVLKAIGTGALYAVGGAVYSVGNAVKWLFEKAVDLFGVLSTLFSAIWPKVKDLAQGWINTAIYGISVAIAAVGGAIQFAWGEIVKFYEMLAEKLQPVLTAVSEAFNKFKESVQGAWNNIGDTATSTWDKISAIFETIKKELRILWESIKTSFTSKIDTKVFDPIIAALKNFWAALMGGKDQNGVQKKSGLMSIISTVWDFLKVAIPAIAELLGSLANTLFKGLSDMFTSGGVKETLDGINAGLGTGVLVELLKLFSNLGKATSGLKDSVSEGGLKGLVGTIKEFLGLEDEEAGIKVLADSVLKLVAALVILSLIDADKMNKGLGAFSALMLELGTVIGILSKMSPPALVGVSKGFSALGTAMIELSAALMILSKIDPERLWGSVLAMGALMGELGAFVAILALIDTKVGFGAGIMADKGFAKTFKGIAEGVLLLSASLLVISKIDPDRLWESAKVMGLMFAGIAAILGLVAGLSGIGSAERKWAGLSLAIVSIGVTISSLMGSLLLLVGIMQIVPLADINRAMSILVELFKVFLVSVAAIALAAKLAGEDAALVGAAVLGMAIAIRIVVNTLIELAIVINFLGADVIVTASVALAILAVGFAGMLAILTAMAPQILMVGTGVMQLGVGLLALSAAIALLVTTLGTLAAAGSVILVGAQALVTVLIEILKGLLQGIIDLIPLLVTALVTLILGSIFQLLADIIKYIKPLAESIVELIVGLFREINNALETKGDTLGTELGRTFFIILKVAVDALKELVRKSLIALGIVEEVKGEVVDGVEQASSGIVMASSGIGGGLKKTGSSISNFFLKIKNTIASVTDWINKNLAPIFKDIFEDLKTILPVVFGIIRDVIGFIADALPVVGPLITTLLYTTLEIITSLINIITTFSTLVMGFLSGIVDQISSEGLLPFLFDLALTLSTFLQYLIIDVLDSLITNGAVIVEKLVTFVGALMIGLFEGLIETLPAVVEKFIEYIIALLKSVNDSLEGNKEALEIEIGRFIALIISIAVNAIINALKLLWAELDEKTGVPEFLNGIWQKITDFWNNVVKPALAWVSEKVSWVWDNVIHPIVEFLETIWTFIGEFIGWLFTALTDTFNWVVNAVTTAVNTVSAIIQSVIDFIEGIEQIIWDIIQGILNFFSGMMSDIGGILTGDLDFWDVAVGWITDLWEGALSIAGRVISLIDGLLEGIASALGVLDWYNTAKDWIQGLINGILDFAQSVIDGVKRMAENVAKAWNKFWGIESPSKVMRQSGHFIDEGLALGISDMAGEVVDAAAEMGDDTLSTVQSAMDSVMDVMSSDDVYSPTIAPVYDLTNLYAGRDQINSLLDSDPTAMQFKMGDEEGLQAAAAEINDSNVTVADAIDDMYTRLSDFMTKVKGEFGDNTVTLNVYGTEGQDVEELADIVSYRINAALQRERAVYS